MDILGKKKLKRDIAKRIIQVWDDIDRTTQRFVVNGVACEVEGETKFYKSSEINKAIDRLNALITELEK